MLGFFAPVGPAGHRLRVDPGDALALAMRAAQGSMTPLDAVLRWPWHKMLGVWAEARDMHEETWGLLLGVFYRRREEE